MMIEVKLMGGLGNQMFQYAAGRCLADKLGCSVRVDVSDYKNNPLRKLELDQLVPDLKVTGWWDRRLGSREIIREKQFSFSPIHIDPKKKRHFLEGYWQSELYFKSASSLVRRDFRTDEIMHPRSPELQKRLDRKKSVMLHVRRGDYVQNAHTNSFHGTCSMEYYQNSVRWMREKISAPEFTLFSDDPAWVRENFGWLGCYEVAQIYGSDEPVLELSLMSRANHFIIANSSFSWWAAWLGKSADKVVCAPRNWFQDSSVDIKDLLPSEWNRL